MKTRNALKAFVLISYMGMGAAIGAAISITLHEKITGKNFFSAD